MKALIAAIIVVLLGVFAFAFFNVEQTSEGRLPTVSVQGGQLPNFDVDAGSVKIGQKERTVTVPTLDVKSPKEEQLEAAGAPKHDTN